MGADAPLYVVAIGSALLLIAILVVAALCHSALRQGRAFEGQISAPSWTFRLTVGAGSNNSAPRGCGCDSQPPNECPAAQQRGERDIVVRDSVAVPE